MEEKTLIGYVAVVLHDSYHIANGEHFGGMLWGESTSTVYDTQMQAIEAAFELAKHTYGEGMKVVSKKGLQDKHNNALDYYDRDFHIISYPIYK